MRTALSWLCLGLGSALILVGAWFLLIGPRGELDWLVLGISTGSAIGVGLALFATGIVVKPRKNDTRS